MSSAAPTREVIPPEMDRHRVAWLTTEDGRGYATLTRVRFATDGGKIYTSLQRESEALRQIHGHPQVRISLGKGNERVKGPEITGLAFLMPSAEALWARHLMARKYWWLRIPWFWSRRGVLVEITLT
jgi:general stress protein 26